MATIVIKVDVDERIKPTHVDPHTVADALLREDLPVFEPDRTFTAPDTPGLELADTFGEFHGTYRSAEWET